MGDPSKPPKKRRLGLSEAEFADLKSALRYAAVIMIAVSITLLVVMFVSNMVARA